MKKRLRIILQLIVLSFIFTACTNQKTITSEEFKKILEKMKYNVIDIKEQYADYDSIKSAQVAINKDQNYQIEFYTLTDEKEAIAFFKENKKIFETSKSNNAKETSKELRKKSKYILNTNGKYKVISRIKNTVIYVNTDESFQKVTDKILDTIKY